MLACASLEDIYAVCSFAVENKTEVHSEKESKIKSHTLPEVAASHSLWKLQPTRLSLDASSQCIRLAGVVLGAGGSYRAVRLGWVISLSQPQGRNPVDHHRLVFDAS